MDNRAVALSVLVLAACAGSDQTQAFPTESTSCIEEAQAHGRSVPADVRAPEPSEAPPPLEVPAVLIEGKRISGQSQIRPDPATVKAMRSRGVVATTAAFKLCLDTAGIPASVTRLSSSCFPRYDETIRTRMLTWRYSPYSVDGVPKAVCTKVQYVYSVGRRRRRS